MSLSTSINLILLSFVSGLATLIGAFIGHHLHRGKNGLEFGMSFVGVLMLIISFFDLIPEAVATAGYSKTLLFIGLGILAIIIFNIMLPHIHSVRGLKNSQDKSLTKISYLIAAGLILHDFPEGFAVANSYYYSASAGLVVIAALFMHNLPEGYVLSAASNHYTKNNHFYRLAFLSSISTTLGTLLGILLLNTYALLNPLLTALAAGAMIYISVHELLPMSLKFKHAAQFFLGAIAAILTYYFLQIIF